MTEVELLLVAGCLDADFLSSLHDLVECLVEQDGVSSFRPAELDLRGQMGCFSRSLVGLAYSPGVGSFDCPDQLGDLLVLALVFGGSEVDQDLGDRLLAQLDRARVDVGVEQEGVLEDFLQLLPYPDHLFPGVLLLRRVGRLERQQESLQFVLLTALEPLHGEVVLRLRQQHEHTEPVPTLAPSSAAR